ncbi:hypothetical protein JOM56_010032 [Amanita muscaria]
MLQCDDAPDQHKYLRTIIRIGYFALACATKNAFLDHMSCVVACCAIFGCFKAILSFASIIFTSTPASRYTPAPASGIISIFASQFSSTESCLGSIRSRTKTPPIP